MDFNLKDSLLGKQSSTPETYDASLLFRIPRSENRVRYAIEDEHLPFVGFDVWNCYELSFLTDNGLPVSRVLKLVYPASGSFLVESKSLKLYLNAFNMDRFGKTIVVAEGRVAELIRTDLSRLLETDVQVSLFGSGSTVGQPFQAFDGSDLCSQIPETVQESIAFTRFVESPDLLRSRVTDGMQSYVFRTDLLRSNCRVTNQPDWGDLFVSMTAQRDVDLSSVLEYLVSFRKENHFHEEVVEMIYKRFWDIFAPESLMVAAMYTRRGGIDINPIRASHPALVDKILVDGGQMTAKTWRQ